jgi:chromosome partitioning protein
MHAIALVAQKGGAGKSTLAACLAVVAQEAGEKVFVLDMDPQGSLMDWGTVRTAETPEVERVAAAKLDASLAALAAHGYTSVFIDTAGHDSPTAAAAMRAADLCLIPTKPSAWDIKSNKVTRDVCEMLKREYAFVVTQTAANTRSTRAHDGARALEMMGAVVLPFIGNRVDFTTVTMSGLGITEIAPNSRSAEEVRELWVSVKNRLGVKRYGSKTRVA